VEFGEVLGWVGAVLYLVRLLPQPWHTRRTGASDGVSPQALLNGFASDIGWLAYGLAAGLAPVWAAAAVALPIGLVTLSLVRARIRWHHLSVAAGWGVGLAGSWMVGGALGLGTMLGVSVVVNHGPQVLLALRGSDLSGLHPATWWISLADAALWGGYGLLADDVALMAYGVILGSAGVVVLGRIAWTRRGGRPSGSTPAVAP